MSTGKFSEYFQISRESDDNNPDNEYKVEVCFELDENGHPLSIGDGSYGSVYRGRTKGGELVAIKILYNNFVVRPLSDLQPGERVQLFDPLVEKYQLYTRDEENEEESKKKKDGIIQLLSDALEPTEQETSGPKPYSESEHKKKVETVYNKHAPSNAIFDQFWDELTRQSNSTAVARFEKERSITTILRKSSLIESNGQTAEVPNIVDVIGGCNNFLTVLQSNLRDLKGHFSEKINVSNYILVTERYDFSLKDLLERPTEVNQHGGYATLGAYPHLFRACEALNIARQVALGLQTLHKVHIETKNGPKVISLFHRDIKPANVFIRVKADGTMEVALGDLGSLPTDEMDFGVFTSGTGFVGYEPPDYAPGTRHYRSPEQMHYRDIADVQVVHLPEDGIQENVWKIFKGEFKEAPDGDQLRTVLIVTDPKFQNTLIEENDVVFFSKDKDQKTYLITNIIRPAGEDGPKERSGHVAYVLNNRRPAENKTQVEFYKPQKYRTDIFGIGALIFDIMTKGSSPERFYVSISKFERERVSETVRKYNALRGGIFEGENPDFSAIFQPFHNENDPINPYPDDDIIELTLRCMLYQSPETFYDEAKEDPIQASIELYKKINELFGIYIAKRLSNSEIPLTTSILIANVTIDLTSTNRFSFQKRIDELQELTIHKEARLDRPTEAINRLIVGTYYFWKLIGFIQDTINEKPWLRTKDADGGSYNETPILQILPPFITLEKEQTKFGMTAPAVFPKEDLRKNRLDLLIRSAANPFVPKEIASSQREIRLFPVSEVDGPVSYVCNYRFLDSAIVKREIATGDRLIIKGELWDIIDNPSAEEIKIVFKPPEGHVDIVDPFVIKEGKLVAYVDATYFSAINPLKYYFEIFGLYLQQLVFTYSPMAETSRDRIDIPALLTTFEVGGPKYIVDKPSWDTDNQFREILQRFIDMLVKLNLHGAEASYYQAAKRHGDPMNDLKVEMLDDLYNDSRSLYERIWKLARAAGNPDAHPTPFESMQNVKNIVTEKGDIPFDDIELWIKDLVEDPIDILTFLKRSKSYIGGKNLSQKQNANAHP